MLVVAAAAAAVVVVVAAAAVVVVLVVGVVILEKSRADSRARGFSGRERKRLFIARSLLD